MKLLYGLDFFCLVGDLSLCWVVFVLLWMCCRMWCDLIGICGVGCCLFFLILFMMSYRLRFC